MRDFSVLVYFKGFNDHCNKISHILISVLVFNVCFNHFH